MNEQERAIINQKVKSFKDKKEKVLTQLDLLKNNQIISGQDNSSMLINIINKLKGIHHYEEILILNYFDESIVLINGFTEPLDAVKKLEIKYQLIEMSNFIDRFIVVKESFQSYTTNILSDAIINVNEELSRFNRLRNIADNAKTENIYNNAVIKYKKLEDGYRLKFYIAMGITLSVSVAIFLCKSIFVPNLLSNLEFWILKISILVVGVTLVSYFIKQSSHYQTLADQNYQTQVELQAYPSFMESIPSNEAASVRKELALKYFGREIDSAAHKEMGNLVSDQMKSTTDMVKATTEAIKNLNGKGSA